MVNFFNLFIFLFEKNNRLFFAGKFLGQRFIQGKDYSLILIYDSKGAIAGSQMAVS